MRLCPIHGITMNLSNFKVPQSKQDFRAGLSTHIAFFISRKLGFSSEEMFYMGLKIFPSKQRPISNNSEFLKS
jgi:hypothetical protein